MLTSCGCAQPERPSDACNVRMGYAKPALPKWDHWEVGACYIQNQRVWGCADAAERRVRNDHRGLYRREQPVDPEFRQV